MDVNLVGASARARSTIQKFQPQRTKGVSFSDALQITGELAKLGRAEIKSLHFFLSAEGFHWKGSTPLSSGRLGLLDTKSLHRKERFHLTAHFFFRATSPQEKFIDEMLAGIERETAIRFEKEARLAAFQPDEPGRATPTELLATVLAWNETIESVGRAVREQVSLEGVPHLMTTHQAHNFLFDPAVLGKSVRVDFSRIVRRWLKEEFPDYTPAQDFLEEGFRRKEVAEGLVTTLHVDKRSKAFGKEFTIGVGVGLTSPRFAPAANQPLQLLANLFRFFGIGPLPMLWTYRTESDLREALAACAAITKKVLRLFEPEAAKIRSAYQRSPEEFAGPRELSAREAYQTAIPIVASWAEDAGLIRLSAANISGPYLAQSAVLLPSLHGDGKLALSGAWILTFHSRRKQENIYVTVPYRGSIVAMGCDAPAGRQWPSDADQVFRQDWIDSGEALRLARAKIQEVTRWNSSAEPQLVELSSRANLAASTVTLPPPGGMLQMETSWRISFSHMAADSRSIAIVSVPAYGRAEATADVHNYDKHGRPTGI